MAKVSEQILIEQIMAGKESAFKYLFEEYYPALVIFAKKFTQDLEVAKDLVQECFVKIFENRSTINIHTSLKSYLYQAVRNRCLNYIQHIKTHKTHLKSFNAEIKDDPLDFKNKMEETELEEKIYELVSQLPEKCREIYLMSRTKGLKNQEIADQLNLSIRTVETQISKALKILRKDLRSYLKLLIYIFIHLNI